MWPLLIYFATYIIRKMIMREIANMDGFRIGWTVVNVWI